MSIDFCGEVLAGVDASVMPYFNNSLTFQNRKLLLELIAQDLVSMEYEKSKLAMTAL
ncbi:hypothetical protein ACNJX9_09610 [Bradyrhizobium sp. DASA03076]|uniref:hypothetical protein n=1 Tax=Bradyrhizobium sp. BLXBL-03 TaxID=3395916 RepID=UPI003F6F50E7